MEIIHSQQTSTSPEIAIMVWGPEDYSTKEYNSKIAMEFVITRIRGEIMTKSEMKAVVNRSIKQRSLCRMYFRYDVNYRYYFPLISSDKLFLGIEEDDFILDGYAIRRYVDVTKVQIKEDKYVEILENERILDSIKTPEIDMSNWETVFTSLQKLNQNIIVEKESLKEDEWEFVIGRIDKVFKKFVYVYHFDGDGIWQEEPYKVPYSDITSVSFGTRYVDIFSKHIDGFTKQSK